MILESIHVDSKTEVLSKIIEFYLHKNNIERITLQ